MTTTVFHQTYVTEWHSLFTLISYSASVFSFILISTDDWLLFCMIALCVFSVY